MSGLVELAERLERMVADPAWPRFYMDKAEAEKCAAALRARSSIQPADDAVERVARAVSEEIDEIDAELENTSALAVPCRDEFRRVSSERVARAAIASFRGGHGA